MAPQGLGPADLAGVFEDAFARRDGAQCKDTLAVHAGAADLDASPWGRSGGGSGATRVAACAVFFIRYIGIERRVCACVRARVWIVGTRPASGLHTERHMGKTVIIAEKPSVAQDIVRALTPTAGKFEKHADHFENDQYVVTSAVGHLVEIKAPEEYDVKRGKWSFANLPVVPPHFDLAPIDKAKSRLSAVVKQVKRKDVSAHHQRLRRRARGRADLPPDRAVRLRRQGARKPIQRLWLQSMTPQAIRDGFATSCAAMRR
jgi:hypothetical protein